VRKKKHQLPVGFEVITVVVMKSINFWDITPCSPLSVNRLVGGTYSLHLQDRINNFSKKPAIKQVASILLASAFHLLDCWFLAEIISSTPKMEAICSSETSVDTQRTTLRYFPEVVTLYQLPVFVENVRLKFGPKMHEMSILGYYTTRKFAIYAGHYYFRIANY
jgi:hypothetical protein